MPAFTEQPDSMKKVIFIVAGNKGAEIFDLLAPFHVFSAAGSFNVFIVAPQKKPLYLWKGLFTLPHLSFREASEIKPDLVVIPALLEPKDTQVLHWLREQDRKGTMFLTICEGSRVIGEAGMFAGKKITSHASSIRDQEKKYPGMNWVSNLRYVEDGRLLSTSGVSSAVEGALVMVRALAGDTVMEKTKSAVRYPYDTIGSVYQGKRFGWGDRLTVLKKTMFSSNKHIGVFIHEGIDEMKVGAVLDAYNRTFPASITTLCRNNQFVRSRYGLLLFPTQVETCLARPDELHILGSAEEVTTTDQEFLRQVAATLKEEKVIYYNNDNYIFDVVLKRIDHQFGNRFTRTVEHLLDYPSIYNTSLQQ